MSVVQKSPHPNPLPQAGEGIKAGEDISKLLIASHNAGKVREIGDLLAPLDIEAVSAASLNLPEPEETGKTFVENALIKSRAAALKSGLPALADDSGLMVDALGGAPGIYSARWAGLEKDFSHAMQRIEKEVHETGVEPTGARASFVCVLSLCFPEGTAVNFEGIVKGTLTFPPRGAYGFGYDPIFIPDGESATFGEMEPAAKHRISHRAHAFRKLLDYLGHSR